MKTKADIEGNGRKRKREIKLLIMADQWYSKIKIGDIDPFVIVIIDVIDQWLAVFSDGEIPHPIDAHWWYSVTDIIGDPLKY